MADDHGSGGKGTKAYSKSVYDETLRRLEYLQRRLGFTQMGDKERRALEAEMLKLEAELAALVPDVWMGD